MKDSGVEWIGEIPDEWTVIPLKYTAKCNNQVLSERTDGDTQIFYIDIGSVSSDGNILEVQTLSFEEAPSRARRVVYENDTIISTVRTYLKAIAFISKSYNNFIVSTGFAVLTPQKQYDSRYFYYALRVDWFISLIESNSVGISYPAINSEKLISLPNIVPPLQTQNRIASFLDTKCSLIDSTIEKEREVIDKLKEYRQAVITEAVTKGIRPGVLMKDSGVEWIGEIPEGWSVIKLKWLLQSPLQYGANESGDEFDEELPRYIRITDISQDGQLKEDNKLSLSLDKSQEYLLKEGDVLFARSGATVGKSFLYHDRYGCSAFAGYLIRAKPNQKKLLSELLYYYTQSTNYEEWKNQIFIQATIQNIGGEKYSQLKLVVPPLSEQSHIISYLDAKCSAIDATIQKRELAIEKLTAYKQSLIYECVTGKKEVLG